MAHFACDGNSTTEIVRDSFQEIACELLSTLFYLLIETGGVTELKADSL